MKLKGRRSLVTAASSGIAKACAYALAQEGAELFICARGPERLSQAAQEVGARGFLATDISSASGTDLLVEAATAELGGLDILVTSVPNPRPGSFDEMSDEDFEITHKATLLSVVRLVRLTRPHLVESPQGRIVNLSSRAAGEFVPDLMFSSTYRAALDAMTKHLAVDLAPHGVTVNNIALGNILTPAWNDESARAEATEIPVGRLGRPEEIGTLCAYLCSEQAAFITGQSIIVDGGQGRAIR